MAKAPDRSFRPLKPDSAARLLCIAAMAAPLSFAAPAASQTHGRTIGLVLTSWRHALHETPGGKLECPAGFAADEKAQLYAGKDPDGRMKRFGNFVARGPNGESAQFAPMLVEDPIPFSELQTRIGYGLNLDGTRDGEATDNTCKHEKFTSPEGVRVDNQMARIVGCTLGWRTDGFNTEFTAQEFENSPLNRIVIEISGVDDERNDPQVDVTYAKGRDKLVASAPGKFIPFLIQRIDERYPRFISRTRGKIVDGVLTTEPIPVVDMSVLWVTHPGETRFRDLRLSLKLTPEGAEGYVGAYADVRNWWNMHSRGIPATVGKFSHAAYYRAMIRYADGYKDPATGQCRAVSASYKVKAVRALIPPRTPKAAGQVAALTPIARNAEPAR